MKNYISSERQYLFEPNVYIEFLVQISGDPEPEDLVFAVKAAFSNNESTMSRIFLDKDGTAFYEKMDKSGCNVSIKHRDWKEIIKENVSIAFNIHQGELMRVFIIPSREKVFLLIISHHLAGDAKSIVYFIEDVLKALSGEHLEYKPLHLVSSDDCPKESKLPFYFKLYADSINKKWRKNSKNFSADDYFKIHETYWKNHYSQVIYESFSPEEMNRIKSCAKKMGVTINSFITTAFLKADTNNDQVGIAVDARIDHNCSMSNQVTGINVKHRYSDKKSFAENASIIHQKIHKKLKNPLVKFFVLRFMPLFDPSLIDSMLLHINGLYENKVTSKFSKLMAYKGKKIKNLGITNLAKLDIESKYGPYKITKVLFIAPVSSYTKNIISVVTLEDEMMFSYHFMSTNNNIKKEWDFFAKAIQNIREAI